MLERPRGQAIRPPRATLPGSLETADVDQIATGGGMLLTTHPIEAREEALDVVIGDLRRPR